jgi:hypothetical protein
VTRAVYRLSALHRCHYSALKAAHAVRKRVVRRLTSRQAQGH